MDVLWTWEILQADVSFPMEHFPQGSATRNLQLPLLQCAECHLHGPFLTSSSAWVCFPHLLLVDRSPLLHRQTCSRLPLSYAHHVWSSGSTHTSSSPLSVEMRRRADCSQPRECGIIWGQGSETSSS